MMLSSVDTSVGISESNYTSVSLWVCQCRKGWYEMINNGAVMIKNRYEDSVPWSLHLPLYKTQSVSHQLLVISPCIEWLVMGQKTATYWVVKLILLLLFCCCYRNESKISPIWVLPSCMSAFGARVYILVFGWCDDVLAPLLGISRHHWLMDCKIVYEVEKGCHFKSITGLNVAEMSSF